MIIWRVSLLPVSILMSGTKCSSAFDTKDDLIFTIESCQIIIKLMTGTKRSSAFDARDDLILTIVAMGPSPGSTAKGFMQSGTYKYMQHTSSALTANKDRMSENKNKNVVLMKWNPGLKKTSRGGFFFHFFNRFNTKYGTICAPNF